MRSAVSCGSLHRVRPAAARPARSPAGQVTLKFSSSPGTSSGAWPSASTALASSVTAGAGLRQRALQQAQAEHLRRLRRPLVAARSSVRATRPSRCLLQRVGQRQRQQAADRVVQAGVDQPVDPCGPQQAARRVVHQHPVVVAARRARCSSARPLATRVGPRGAAAARHPGALAAEAGHGASNCVVVAAPAPPAWPCSRGTRGQRRQRVRHHRAAGQRGVLLGPRRRRRARPTPAQGTRAEAARRVRGRGQVEAHAPMVAASSERSRALRAPCLQSRIAPQRPLRGVLCCPHRPCNCPPSPPASASPCPAPSARPTPCCWPASRWRARPPGSCWPSSPPSRPTRSGWPTNCPSSRPALRVAVFPDWETLPYDTFSPHQDLISERLATLWRMRSGERRRGAAARHHRADAAGAARLPGRLHLPLQAEDAARRGRAEGAAHAGRLQPRQPGGVARRVRGARRADRPVPDGLAGALPRGPVRRRGRFDPHLRPRHASAACTRCPRCACCRAASSRWTRPRAPPSARAGARRSKATRPRSRIYKDIGAGHRHRRHRVLPAAVLRADGHDLRLPRRRTPRWCCTARSTRRCSASGPTRASATASCSTTRERPDPAAGGAVPAQPRSSSPAPARTPRWRCAAASAVDWARPLPDVSVDRGATEPLAALEQHLDATPHRVLLVAESEGRRESLLELLRDHRIERAQRGHAGRVRGRRREGGHRRRAAGRGLLLARAGRREASRSSSSPRPNSSPPRRRRAGAASRSRPATSMR